MSCHRVGCSKVWKVLVWQTFHSWDRPSTLEVSTEKPFKSETYEMVVTTSTLWLPCESDSRERQPWSWLSQPCNILIKLGIYSLVGGCKEFRYDWTKSESDWSTYMNECGMARVYKAKWNYGTFNVTSIRVQNVDDVILSSHLSHNVSGAMEPKSFSSYLHWAFFRF